MAEPDAAVLLPCHTQGFTMLCPPTPGPTRSGECGKAAKGPQMGLPFYGQKVRRLSRKQNVVFKTEGTNRECL